MTSVIDSARPCAWSAAFARGRIFLRKSRSARRLDELVQAVKWSPNIGRPLFDSAFVASSCKTSQCSARRPFSILTISAATQATGRPFPEKRPWTNVVALRDDELMFVTKGVGCAADQIE